MTDNNTAAVSDEVIAVCAVNATLKTPGVVGMAESIPDMLSKNILRKEVISKGVKVNQSRDGFDIDVYITAGYGYKIPAVAWDIQENVKNEIKAMTGHTVKTVNIHVQGVKRYDEK